MLKYGALIYLLSGGLGCLSLGYLALRRKATGARLFAGLMLSVAIYVSCYALQLISPDTASSLRWIQFAYIGMSQIPVFWLALSLCYTNRTWWLEPRRIWLLWIVPLIVLTGVWTNDLHHWFFVSSRVAAVGPFYTLVNEHGPIHWLHTIYGGLTLMFSCVALARQYLSPHALYRRQVSLMLFAGLWVVLFTSAHVAGIHPIPNLDLTPFAILLACLVLGVGLLQYRLIDLTPIARDVLFDRLSDSALVLDERGRLIDFNPSAQRLMGLSEESLGRYGAASAPAQTQAILARLAAGETTVQINMAPMLERIFEVQQTPLNLKKGVASGQLVVIHDVTERVQAQKALTALNANLERRVEQRIQEHLITIDRLEAEVEARRLAEQKLHKLQEGLLERLGEQSRKLNAIYEVLLDWSPKAAEDILNQSLERTAQIMDAQAACFHERESDGWLRRTADWGLTSGEAEQMERLSGAFLEANPALISLDLAQEKRLPDGLRLERFNGYLAAPMELRDGTLGLLQLFYHQSRPITIDDFVFLNLITEQLAIILENTRLRQAVERRAAQRAAQLERQRLGRDLHDSVTQSLHSLALQTEVLRYRLSKGRTGPALQTLKQIEDSARQAVKEMRLLLYEMRLSPDETARWLEMLQMRLEAVEGRAGIRWTLEAPPEAAWPEAWEPDLYAITTEALNNSLKHAAATQVRVQIRGGPGWLRLEIQDDGCGFDPARKRVGGIGLESMSERAGQLGGRLLVRSEPGQGVSIQLDLGQPEA